MENKKIRRILPLCLSAVIAAGATSVVDHITLKGDVPAYAGMFGDVNGDGVVNASDAAVILQFAAWSGAGNDGDLAYYLAQRGIAQPTEPETVIPTEEVTEPPTEELTEPPTDPAEEVSDLYAALSAEWERTGDTSVIDLSKPLPNNPCAVVHKGKIYFRLTEYGMETTTIYAYDIATKELSSISLEGSSYNDKVLFSQEGYFYYKHSGGSLTKYDLEGNQLGSTGTLESYVISDTGYIFSSATYCTPDLEEKSFPDCVVKDSHGLDNTINMIICGLAYGSKCITYGNDKVTGKNSYYQFDASTGEWTLMPDSPLNKIGTGTTKSIGRYRIIYHDSSSYVYDTESDTMLAEKLPGDFGQTYFGGTSNIIMNVTIGEGCVFRRMKPLDGKNVFDRDNAVVICTDSSTSGSFLPLDDTYYLYTDAAGIFLRTYEKGAEGEELVYRFEQ